MNKYSLSKRGGDLCLDFNQYDYWESLEELVEIVKDRFDVQVLEEIEGPSSRVLKLEVNNEVLSLQYDSYGSFLRSLSRDTDSLLQEIKSHFENIK